MQRLGIAWQVGSKSGWGVFGLNLSLQLALKGRRPVPFAITTEDLSPLHARVLAPALKDHGVYSRLIEGDLGATIPFPVLHGMGDRLATSGVWDHVRGLPDVGVVFFESVDVPAENVAAANRFALIVAGSTWNWEVLTELGVRNAVCCPQGIDPSLFHPAPRLGLFPDRFVVFSGGKLEFRKGQDLVLRAFEKFHRRHPEALLVTAWHNHWPASLETLTLSPHVAGVPAIVAGRLDLEPWLMANGLPAGSFLDVGLVPNALVPQVVREADVAVFPNRCEGGTNLVAMECMACGVPAILSRNTGHLDLLAEPGAAYPLDLQLPLDHLSPAFRGWGESVIEEIVDKLESAYSDREEAARRGRAGADFLAGWSWSNQVDRLLAAVDGVC